MDVNSHLSDVAALLLLICGVMKNLVTFFHPNSLHICEQVIVLWVIHVFYHSSSEIYMFNSDSHLFLMYRVEIVLFSPNAL